MKMSSKNIIGEIDHFAQDNGVMSFIIIQDCLLQCLSFYCFSKPYLKLFDSLIKPILMYGCAVWGYGAINEMEAYHLQFTKRTLGVKVTTNYCVVYTETGRFPLHIHINVCMIKYWINILNSDVNKLIHVACKKMLQHPEKYACIRHIKDLLCCHGFGYIGNYQAVTNEKAFLSFFEQRIKDEFIQKCFSDNQNSD